MASWKHQHEIFKGTNTAWLSICDFYIDITSFELLSFLHSLHVLIPHSEAPNSLNVLNIMMLNNGMPVLTRSPYLFIAIVNGLMPMKNLWLLASIIRLFSSQMILLCSSFCKEHHAAATPSHQFLFCLLHVPVEGFRCRSASHIVIIVDAMLALPDLPLIQDQLVRVRDHRLWTAEQDGQQSCSQQGADMLPCQSTAARVHHYSIQYIPHNSPWPYLVWQY